MKRNEGKALLQYAGAMAIYGTIGIFRRLIPLSSGMLAGCRGLIGGLLLLLWIRVRGGRLRLNIPWNKKVLLAITGGLIGLNWILLFEAYNYTTVGIATLCYYMEPTLLILLSPLVFREKLTWLKGTCAALSFCGMAFISGIMEGHVPEGREVLGILLGLGAASLYTTVIILNKKTPVEDAASKTVVQLLSAAVVMVPYLLLTGTWKCENMSLTAVLLTLVVGGVHTGIAYALYFGSMQKLSSQTVAVLGYIDPVLALLLSWLLLGESLQPIQLVGAALIIGSALVSETVGNKSKQS